MDRELHAAAARLREADRVLFITGAGISADSGMPTYRGVGGLYEGRATEEGMPIEEALSGETFRARPDLSWKYLWEIGRACRDASPNRGHEVIAEIERARPDTWVLTQNVDGLHRAAGSRNLIEIHGRASELSCTGCSFHATAEDLLAGYGEPVELPPRCPDCGGVIRPDVVLFGEMLPEEAVHAMQRCAAEGFDMVIAVGTTGLFPYIAEPVVRAKMAGIPTVEINPEETELADAFDHCIRAGAAVSLDRLWSLAGS